MPRRRLARQVALREGDAAPPFRALDAEGRAWSDADLRGRRYVLFFYPADETPGCIKESCAFRDAWEDFRALGVQVLGVSRDDAASHRDFARRRRLPYPLLADPDGAMHRAYDALHFGALPRRVTYLVDEEGRIAAVFASHLRPRAHAGRMLEAARGPR